MLRSITGALSAIAMMTAANAADIYRPQGSGGFKDPVYVPVTTWTGFYIGANGGYGWDNSSHDVREFDSVNSSTDRFKGPEADGGFGGGQIGYNWQRDQFVFGVEADIQGSDISDTVTTSPTDLLGAALGGGQTAPRLGRVGSSLDWFGSVRGRLGYSIYQTLIYATGGFAYGGVSDSVFYNDTVGNTLNFKSDDTKTGYTVGGGVEYKLSPAWSLKAEYQYIDLGSTKFDGQFIGRNPDKVTTSEIDHTYNTVRVGLNYHIENEYVPLK